MSKLRQPCENCPWRVDAPREYWDSSHFLSIWGGCQDDGLSLMGCHKSNKLPPKEQIICQGWIRVVGYEAIGVRLAVIQGKATDEEVQDRSGPKLFPDFASMLKANRIRLPKRNRFL